MDGTFVEQWNLHISHENRDWQPICAIHSRAIRRSQTETSKPSLSSITCENSLSYFNLTGWVARQGCITLEVCDLMTHHINYTGFEWFRFEKSLRIKVTKLRSKSGKICDIRDTEFLSCIGRWDGIHTPETIGNKHWGKEKEWNSNYTMRVYINKETYKLGQHPWPHSETGISGHSCLLELERASCYHLLGCTGGLGNNCQAGEKKRRKK